MSDQPETPKLIWRDGGIPVAARFDDPYFSLNDGLAETRHVFLAGNDLPRRFADGFLIAELGFGTGLNLVAAWHAWRSAGMNTQLRYASFEMYPMAIADMERSLSLWPELETEAQAVLAALSKHPNEIDMPTLRARIIVGDARKTLTQWPSRADAWFLDGFSPAKNPELWSPDLMQQVAQHTSENGTFATYSAAGHVRQSLSQAGFDVQRVAGFGRKRHMTIGQRRMPNDTE